MYILPEENYNLLLSCFNFSIMKHINMKVKDYFIFRKNEKFSLDNFTGYYLKEEKNYTWSIYLNEKNKKILLLNSPYIELDYLYMRLICKDYISKKNSEILDYNSHLKENYNINIFNKNEEVFISDIEGRYIKKNEDNSYSIYEYEREKDNLVGTCPSLKTIIEYLYYNSLCQYSMYDYREEWEKETGLQF